VKKCSRSVITQAGLCGIVMQLERYILRGPQRDCSIKRGETAFEVLPASGRKLKGSKVVLQADVGWGDWLTAW
jgi:hypothetical protein